MGEQKSNKTIKISLIVLAIFLIIDQASKIFAFNTNIDIVVIENIFNLKLVLNSGIAFGVGQGSNLFTFIISNIIILGIIIRFIYIQKDRMDQITMYSLFTILAGGIGNMLDRIFRGEVIDFLNILPKYNLPVFNFSDIYIVGGWMVLAFVFAKYTYQEIKYRKK